MRLLTLFTGACLLCAGDSFAAATFDADGWTSIRFEGGRILLPVTLTGIDGEAVIDTGAEVNAIDQIFVDEHRDALRFGGTIAVRGVYTTEQKRLVNGLTVGLFGLDVQASGLVPTNLAPAELLLGINFLKSFIVQIDYPKERMRLISHKSLKLEDYANVEMREQKGSSLALVKVSLNPGDETWVTLDTGLDGGLFLPRFIAKRYDWLEKYESEHHLGIGAGSVGVSESFRIPFFAIGPYEFENVPVSVPAEGQSSSVGRPVGSNGPGTESRGLMGNDILRHFVVTLDAKHMKMHLALPNTEGGTQE
jgi:hypothetical protein